MAELHSKAIRNIRRLFQVTMASGAFKIEQSREDIACPSALLSAMRISAFSIFAAPGLAQSKNRSLLGFHPVIDSCSPELLSNSFEYATWLHGFAVPRM